MNYETGKARTVTRRGGSAVAHLVLVPPMLVQKYLMDTGVRKGSVCESRQFSSSLPFQPIN
jgi:hypothetical protein